MCVPQHLWACLVQQNSYLLPMQASKSDVFHLGKIAIKAVNLLSRFDCHHKPTPLNIQQSARSTRQCRRDLRQLIRNLTQNEVH